MYPTYRLPVVAVHSDRETVLFLRYTGNKALEVVEPVFRHPFLFAVYGGVADKDMNVDIISISVNCPCHISVLEKTGYFLSNPDRLFSGNIICRVKAYNDMEILGQTIDDAAGEAIDKCSKVMGLGYPGGPIIDKLARQGNPKAFTFSKPHIPGLDYSFSGLKTSFLYSLRDWLKEDPDFIEHHKVDLAASLEATVVDILMDKLRKAAKEYKINEIAVAGGVSANNGLRNAFREHAEKYGWNIFIPKFSYTTDNAAMIAITGYFKYLDKDFCSIDLPAYSRVTL